MTIETNSTRASNPDRSKAKEFSCGLKGIYFSTIDRSECFGKIRRDHETFDQIEEIRPILEVVTNADHLDVICDFNNSNLLDKDPTRDSDENGVCYCNMVAFLCGR